MKTKDIFNLSFDIRLREEKQSYGFIVRIISNNHGNIDMIVSLGDSEVPGEPRINIVSGNTSYCLLPTVEFGQWHSTSMTIDKKSGTLTVSIDSNEVVIPGLRDNFNTCSVTFGQCTLNEFASTDVAPFDLRNVSVSRDSKPFRKWDLREYSETGCVDENHGTYALATNPYWLIDDNYAWKEVHSIKVNSSPQCAFDAKNDFVYVIQDNSRILRYDLAAGKESVIQVKGGVPATNNFSQLIVDTLRNQLVSFKIDEGRVSMFDFGTRLWSMERQVFPKSRHWHHTSTFNPVDTSVLSFGGYGYYKYNNILTKFDLNANEHRKINLEGIFPRYSSSSCVVGDTLYIYGGRGSETGSQEISTVYLYDLFGVDTKTWEVTHVGDFPVEQTMFLPAENMVYNREEKELYVLTDADGGRLLRLSPESGKAEFIGGTLPKPMSSKYLYRNLFHSDNLSRLYAVYDTDDGEGNSVLEIYSINYPPLTRTYAGQSVSKPFKWWLYAALALFAAAIMTPLAVRRRKVTGNEIQDDRMEGDSEQFPPTESSPKETGQSRAGVYLLGDFRVLDKEGKDISSEFTPTIRNFLVLVILNSDIHRNGILGTRLDETLWSHKSAESARNNRYVTLRRLRILLSRIGDVSVNTKSDYWNVSFPEGTSCDYLEAKNYLLSGSRHESETKLDEILETLRHGPLLPQIEEEWLDSYKSDFSNETVDFLSEILKTRLTLGNSRLCVKIADTILSHDILNEEAMEVKCRLLYGMGKKSLAVNAYELFSREYKLLLNEDYPRTLADITSKAK